jgi:acid phosphatase type 7
MWFSPRTNTVRRTFREMLAAGGVAVAMLRPTPARADELSFVKGPYQQGVTARSAIVRWETSIASGGTLTVKGPNAFSRDLVTQEPERFHALTIQGLEPSTSYTYSVTALDVKSPEGRIVTAPEDDRPFTFLLYGDNRSDPAAHEAVVKAMMATPSDFLLHTGDMVLEGDDETNWRHFFEIESRLLRDRCVFACIGNHELIGEGRPPFLRFFHPGVERGQPTLFSTVRWGTTRFFLLNAMVGWDAPTDRGWLDAELTKADEEPGLLHRIVVLHHGPFSSGPHGGNEPFARTMLGSLRAHKVDVLFAGHDHIYERGDRDGVRYIISGGGGAPLYKVKRSLAPGVQRVEPVHHFVAVEVEPKVIKTSARRVDGSILEQCALTQSGWACDAPPPAPAETTPPRPGPAGESKKSCSCSFPGDPHGGGVISLLLGGSLCAAAARRRRFSRGVTASAGVSR